MTAATLPARLAGLLRRTGQERRGTLILLGPVLGASAWTLFGPLAGLALMLLLPLAAVALPEATAPAGPVAGPDGRDGLVRRLDAHLALGRQGLRSGAIAIGIDRFARIEERLDHAATETLLRECGDRLARVLRDGDHAARLGGPVFGIALGPTRRFDLEAAIQLSGRLQHALAEPFAAGGARLYLTASVGFALDSRIDDPTGEGLLQAAQLAMIEAGRSGPGAIRSYSGAMRARVDSRDGLAGEVAEAMERGQITAFFQPQVSTRTGAVTGCESLARWLHPDRGLIPPAEFLPALRQAGMMDRLGTHMVAQAMAALRAWDDAGIPVARVGVNFSTEELVDPRLVDRISWQLDRFDLTPDRLGIEVLETVVADRSDDIVVRNLTALARLGCRLDLDDFGTGHASITSIRRFAIGRIKIDRTFVTRIDEDPEQQAMVSAILTMAERLGLDTLAEGVETAGEQAMLARLGCGHVQGFGIARPMPLAEATAWLSAARDRAGGPVPLRRKA